MYCNLDASSMKEVYELEPFSTEKNLPKPVIPLPFFPIADSSLVNRSVTVKSDKSTVNPNTYLQLIACANARAEIEFSSEWGGKDGIEFSFGGSASVHDDRGNFVEVEVSQEVSKGGFGEGEASIRAGHENN